MLYFNHIYYANNNIQNKKIYGKILSEIISLILS